MPPEPARSPARLLAPAALVIMAIAVILIVLSSADGDDGSERATTVEEGSATTEPAAGGRRAPRSTYRVKRGDTLGSIAEKTGVEVERLQELNPQLDAQAINPGQKIKLRE